jgi:uncharacterized membrane protein
VWPALFGAGWGWGILVALSLASLFAGFLGFLLLITNRESREAAEPLDQVWHRYEEGDITGDEFKRLKPRRGV